MSSAGHRWLLLKLCLPASIARENQPVGLQREQQLTHSVPAQDYKLKLNTLERRRLDYDADRRAITKLEQKRNKSAEKNVAVKAEVTTSLQAKEHTALGAPPLPCCLSCICSKSVTWGCTYRTCAVLCSATHPCLP